MSLNRSTSTRESDGLGLIFIHIYVPALTSLNWGRAAFLWEHNLSLSMAYIHVNAETAT
jgi:hypothetical protein